MSRTPTDWKTKLPQIIDKIENDHFSPCVAAEVCGVGASTLSEAMSRDAKIRNAIAEAKAKKFASIVETPLSRLARNEKSPHHFNAIRLIALTQGKEYGYSEKESIVQNIVAVLPGVNIMPSEKFLVEAEHTVIPTVQGNGHDNGD